MTETKLLQLSAEITALHMSSSSRHDALSHKPTKGVCVRAPYMGIFVEEVETVLIDSNDTGSVKGGGAAAVDVEERRAEHGECTDQA